MKIKELFSKKYRRRWLIAILLIIVSVVAGIVALIYQGHATAPLTDIHSMQELQVMFNQDKDQTRLVLLMSPT